MLAVILTTDKVTKQKSNFNWYFLLAGILVLYFGLTNNQSTKQSSLEKITVKLDKDITNVKGRRSSVDYKFWTKEYNNQFNILNGSITRGQHEAIADLKGGQVVEVHIKTADLKNLSDGKEDIDIMGISKNGITLMTTDEFYHNRDLYKVRLKMISVFTALMLILNGLTNISRKINYIIIGTFIGAIIIMRMLEIVIY
uniref:hypothetical protein n=1 Tax=Fulvivirga sp. TaxID=1931237 RepID=UPI00404AC662